jgi:addiction module HigA family antidote
MSNDDLGPVHPGEVLREEFLVPLALTPGRLAKALHVPRTRIERLAKETVPVTADTALRLSRYFGTTPNFWLSLQIRHDLETVRPRLREDLDAIVPRPPEPTPLEP